MLFLKRGDNIYNISLERLISIINNEIRFDSIVIKLPSNSNIIERLKILEDNYDIIEYNELIEFLKGDKNGSDYR